MAKQGGLGDNFYVGGYDLSGDINSVDQVSSPWDVLDFTAINESAHERGLSLRNGSIQFTTFFDYAGSTAAPAVPASGTAYKSTYDWYVLVTVTGGAVTNVTINGATVGTGDGTYLLPPLGAITLTYTTAPTWTWSAVGAEHNALSTLPSTDTIASYFVGQAVGNPAACVNGKRVNYDWTRDNTGGLTGKVSVMANSYGLEWGKQLTAGVHTDTTAGNGTSVNDLAATSFGAQAYLQLFALVGTSVDIAVQDSADGATWANVAGLDFGAQASAPYVARLAIANTATLRQYVRVVSTGTFTYARYAVMYNRNLVAGVTF